MNARLFLTLSASLFLLAGCGGGGGGGGGTVPDPDPDPAKLSVELTGVTQTAGDRVVVPWIVKAEREALAAELGDELAAARLELVEAIRHPCEVRALHPRMVERSEPE